MSERIYYQPMGIVSGTVATALAAEDFALPLKGGPLHFTHLQIVKRGAGLPTSTRTVRVGTKKTLATLIGEEAISRLTQPSTTVMTPLLNSSGPTIMGILNVTPDSFSDGGAWTKLKDAVAHARRMHEDGAAIVDIGGESTRPGAQTVTEEEEIARVVDVIDGCADASVHCISIDTRKARVMEAALRAGARMINDVSALTFDPDALSVAAATDVPIVLMHAQGTPETMQDDPHYNDVVFDIYDYLSERVESCVAAGVARERLIVDPGIGFGKTIDHNLALLNSLSLFHGLGLPVLVGASRKRYIEAVDRATPPGQRLGGSLAAVAAACAHGIDIVRVHDVAETRQFIALSKATASAGDTPNSQ